MTPKNPLYRKFLNHISIDYSIASHILDSDRQTQFLKNFRLKWNI